MKIVNIKVLRVFRKLKNRKGILLIEFALALPVLIFLGSGCYEFYKISNAQYFLKHSLYSLMMSVSKDASSANIKKSLQVLINEGAAYGLSDRSSFIVTGLKTGNLNNNNIKWVRDSLSYGLTTQTLPTTVVSKTVPALSDKSKFSHKIDTIIIEMSYSYLPGFFVQLGTSLKERVVIDYRGENFPNN